MQVGDRVRVTRNGTRLEGVVLPSSTTEHVVIKRRGGYNVGIDREAADIEVLEERASDIDETEPVPGETSTVHTDDELPTVSVLSTGGTIASTVDYRTGAVSPRFDVSDVLTVIPELQGLANYRGRVVSNMLSENMEPDIWQELAEAIVAEIQAGADGIVVMHGTDTMQYSASAIAFMVETPVPIVFTGSQRSADRPSSDNVINAVCAVSAATSDIAEVLVCMHDTTNDDRCALHRATRVRKNHTSRRDAFETVGGQPLATVSYHDRQVTPSPHASYHARESVEVAVHPSLNTNVELVKFTPGMPPGRLPEVGERDGVIIEGTGLGHVNTSWLETIEELTAGGTRVVMTSQCLDGRVCDRVYETGRDLLDAGVIEAQDTLPETALVKLMWVLENSETVDKAMKRSLKGECTAQSQPWV